MLQSAPITMASRSPRITAPNQILDRAPTVTSPTTVALGATAAEGSMTTEAGFKFGGFACEFDIMLPSKNSQVDMCCCAVSGWLSPEKYRWEPCENCAGSSRPTRGPRGQPPNTPSPWNELQFSGGPAERAAPANQVEVGRLQGESGRKKSPQTCLLSCRLVATITERPQHHPRRAVSLG